MTSNPSGHRGSAPQGRAKAPGGISRPQGIGVVAPAWVPGDLANLWSEIDPRVTPTLVSDEFVSLSPDQSGNGNSPAQAGVGEQPLWLPRQGAPHLYLHGVASNNATSPDSAAISVTGDLRLVSGNGLIKWTPGSLLTLLAKWNPTGNQRSYRLNVTTGGNIQLEWSNNGTTVNTRTSTVGLGLADRVIKYLRARLDVDNGSAGHDVIFEFADSASGPWTQLGTTVTTGGTTSVFDSTAILEIGTSDVGTANLAKGQYYRSQVYDGTTLVFDANFTIQPPGKELFIESSLNAANVQLNRTGDYPACIVNYYAYYFDGVNDHLFLSATLAQPINHAVMLAPQRFLNAQHYIDGSDFNTSGGFRDAWSGSTEFELAASIGADVARAVRFPNKTPGVVQTKLDGLSSLMRVDANSDSATGNGGTGAMGGITIGARADGTAPSLMLFGGMLIYDALGLSSSDRDNIGPYMGSLITP